MNYRPLLTASLPSRSIVLTYTHNKVQLIDIICNHMVRAAEAAKINNKLVITGRDTIQTELCCGVKNARADLLTILEEADIIIVQQVIHIVCNANVKSISVVSDDTYVFVLLCHYYKHLTMTCQLTMEATSSERRKKRYNSDNGKARNCCSSNTEGTYISGCDTVAYLYGIGKEVVVKKLLTGIKLIRLGNADADIDDVVSDFTTCIVACYGVRCAKSTSEARIAA